MKKKEASVNPTNKSKVLPALTPEDIAGFKKRYDPDLVDALFSGLEGADLYDVFSGALKQLLDQSFGGGAFVPVAIARRKHEASLIEQEVRMFEQMANLMTQINTRYAMLTGVPVVTGGSK